jgi:RNA-binding protein
MQKALDGKARMRLRALAHALDPVVQVGRAGLTDAVLTEIGHALEKHELIKVKVRADSPVSAAEAREPIEQGTRSQVAQVIGHVLVVYRRRAKKPKIEPFASADGAAPATRTGKGTRRRQPARSRAKLRRG